MSTEIHTKQSSQDVFWSEDYVYQSFTMDQRQELKEYFEKYGFVVVDGVLTQQECEDSINEVFNEVSNFDQLNRFDPQTWLNEENYSPTYMKKFGIVGNQPVSGYQAFKNRVNRNIYQIFQTLLEEDSLWCNIDRFGFLRPTKNVGGTGIDKPEWRTSHKWLHWDMNPWRPYMNANEREEMPAQIFGFHSFLTENNGLSSPPFRRAQGLVSFVDVGEEDGGFMAVPGVHHHLDAWADKNKDKDNGMNFVSVPSDDELHQRARKIPMKAGSLVVWDSRLAHSNFPNNSENFRICQYITMYSYARNRSLPIKDEALMRFLIKHSLPAGLLAKFAEEDDQLSLKILRLKAWDDDRELLVSKEVQKGEIDINNDTPEENGQGWFQRVTEWIGNLW